jgi:hypothetical protein
MPTCIVEGRPVVVLVQKRQTVRIRAATSAAAKWEFEFCFSAGKHVVFADIAGHSSIVELVDWLVAQGATSRPK